MTKEENLRRVADLLADLRRDGKPPEPAQRDPLAHLAELRAHYAANPVAVSPSLLKTIKPQQKEAAE